MSSVYDIVIAAIFAIITGVIFEAMKSKYTIDFEMAIKKKLT